MLHHGSDIVHEERRKLSEFRGGDGDGIQKLDGRQCGEKVVQLSENEAGIFATVKGFEDLGEAGTCVGKGPGENVAGQILAGSFREPFQCGLLFGGNPDLKLLRLGAHGHNLGKRISCVNTSVMTSLCGQTSEWGR